MTGAGARLAKLRVKMVNVLAALLLLFSLARGEVLDDRHDRKGYDCNDSRLSPKARRMFCREELVEDRPQRATGAGTLRPSSPLLATTEATSWHTTPSSAQTVTVLASTTVNWLDSIPECSSLVPELDDMEQECKNSTRPPPIVRYRDLVFERLVEQAWEDTRHKVNTEKKVSGVNLEPLRVDEEAGVEGPLLEISEETTFYSAQLRAWDVQVHGLSEIYLNEVLVTRDTGLRDLQMMAEFRFDSLSANGTYNINGSLGGWFGTSFTSGGDRAFTVDITNATLTPRVVLDTSSADGPCGKYGDVLITEIQFPFSYDDISIVFDNLGYGYNAVINGLSIFILRTQEENLKQHVRAKIKNAFNSFIC